MAKGKVISINNRAARRAAASNKATPKRKVGRPKGSKNRPVDLPVESKYETIKMYCERMFCSRAAFYASHAKRLKIVKFGGRALIDKEYTDQVAERIARKPAESVTA